MESFGSGADVGVDVGVDVDIGKWEDGTEESDLTGMVEMELFKDVEVVDEDVDKDSDRGLRAWAHREV